MQIKVYHYIYILQSNLWVNLILNIIILLIIKSIFFKNILSNEALAFTVKNPRTIYEPANEVKVEYTYSNGYSLSVQKNGKQVLQIYDGIKIIKELDSSIKVKCRAASAFGCWEEMQQILVLNLDL